MAVANTDSVSCVFVVLLDGDLIQTPEHLGVSYLVALVRRAGYSCALIDIEAAEDEQVAARIAALKPKFVGISLTTVNLPRAIALGQRVRHALGPEVLMCAGGPIATFMGDKLLKIEQWSFVDCIVRGEAEGVIVPLVEAALNDQPVSRVPGVTTRDHTQGFAPVAAVDDITRLPWPARDQLEARDGRIPYVRLSTSRGCTSSCTFCNAPHARNNVAKRKVWRGRHVEDIIAEIEYLVSRYKVDTFDFVDSTFEDPGDKAGKARIRRMAEMILERDLQIYYNTCSQAYNWQDTPEDHALLSLLFQSGLEKTLIGIESGSDRSLKLFKKRSNTADNRRALRLFRQHGVYVAFGFIMFHPYTEWADIEDNATFLIEHLGHNLRRFITRLELYPGAEIVNQIEADGLLEPDYWQTLRPYAYRFANPDVGRMAVMVNSLFGQAYVERSRIDREPSVFAFETLDMTLHTSISRLFRIHHQHPHRIAFLQEYTALFDAEKAALTRFNSDLFYDLMHRAKTGMQVPEGLDKMVEQRYAQAISQLTSIQLRLAMQLERQGIQLVQKEAAYAK
jgi:radical SAM superfamily enzyme YgiQ (UPF0313 family)